MKINTLFKSLYVRFSHPNKVAKLLDVNFGKNCSFGTKSFGTEPYLIYIGDDFYSSSNVQFITHDGSVNVIRNLYTEYKDVDVFQTINIGNNVFLGYGVTVLPGTKIGDNVIVGAGSLARGKLKENSVYAGVPVRYICTIKEYLEKKKSTFMYTKYLEIKDKEIYLKKLINEKYFEINI